MCCMRLPHLWFSGNQPCGGGAMPRHHSDTIIRGRDPEIAVPRPPNLKKIVLGFFGISGAIPEIRRIIIHARR